MGLKPARANGVNAINRETKAGAKRGNYNKLNKPKSLSSKKDYRGSDLPATKKPISSYFTVMQPGA